MYQESNYFRNLFIIIKITWFEFPQFSDILMFCIMTIKDMLYKETFKRDYKIQTKLAITWM